MWHTKEYPAGLNLSLGCGHGREECVAAHLWRAEACWRNSELRRLDLCFQLCRGPTKRRLVSAPEDKTHREYPG